MERFSGKLLSRVFLSDQENERDAVHRDQTLQRHHDSVWLSTLFSVPPAHVLHDRENGEMHKKHVYMLKEIRNQNGSSSGELRV